MEQEQKRLLIRGARILNPARGEDYIGNILISGDRISAVSENLYDADAEVIEAKGLTAVPGFVDMHVHLRDPGFTDKEDIYTGCRAAAAGGKAPFDRRARCALLRACRASHLSLRAARRRGRAAALYALCRPARRGVLFCPLRAAAAPALGLLGGGTVRCFPSFCSPAAAAAKSLW